MSFGGSCCDAVKLFGEKLSVVLSANWPSVGPFIGDDKGDVVEPFIFVLIFPTTYLYRI